ncbi:MAG: hypothetical protein ACP5QO_08800 [Clostridia bacterium]
MLFLDPADLARHRPAIYRALRQHLPPAVAGCSTAFTRPDPGLTGVHVLTASTARDIDHHVTLWSLDVLLTEELGITRGCEPTFLDWLTFLEPKLLQLTAGAVFPACGPVTAATRGRCGCIA